MSRVLVILIGTQMVYSCSDLMGRYYMTKYGFRLASFLSLWFLAYQLIRQGAVFGQLYVFANMELGRTMAMLGATSILISNVLGLLLLKEVLTPVEYVGVTLAIIAFFVMAFR